MSKNSRDSQNTPPAGGPGFHPGLKDIGERGGVMEHRRSGTDAPDGKDAPKDDLPDRKFHTMSDIKHGNADDKGDRGA